ncbi:MAG: ArnT family glycosyltransferase [Acidimicrobiales bacterium]
MTVAPTRLGSSKRLLAIAVLAGALGAMVVRLGGVIALVTPSVLGILLLIALVQGLIRWPDEAARRRIMWWTMVSFGAHLLFGLAATNLSSQVRLYLGTDGITYDLVARAIARHWEAGLAFPHVPSGKEGFYYMLAGLYRVFGPHTSAGLAVNAALAAGLVPVMSDVTHRLFRPVAARYAAPLVVLSPGLFLWTSQLLREAGMLFLIAVALNCAVRLVERVSPAPMMILVAALVLAFTFRAPVALILAVGLLVGIALGHSHVASGFAAGLGALFVVAVVMLASGLGYSGYTTATNVDLKQAAAIRNDSSHTAQTAFAPEVDISSTPSALRYLPFGVVSFVLGPFPWQIAGLRQLPFIPDMIVWWALLPSLWRGFRVSGRLVGRRRLLIILPSVGTILFMSLALGNFGIIVRERLQVVVLVVPLIALGLAERASKRGSPEPAKGAVVQGRLVPQV